MMNKNAMTTYDFADIMMDAFEKVGCKSYEDILNILTTVMPAYADDLYAKTFTAKTEDMKDYYRKKSMDYIHAVDTIEEKGLGLISEEE